MVAGRGLNVRALITRFQVSTNYIAHDANGYRCDVTAVGGRVVPTALEGECKQGKSRERWIL